MGAAEGAERLTSVVRADARSGRLVRQTRVISTWTKPDRGAQTPSRAGTHHAEVHRIIEDASTRHQVDPLLVRSIIEVESAFDPLAVSHKGAQGLMQLMPATARTYGVLNAFDVRDNIEGGVKYFRYLQDLFQDNRLALAAYNAGEAAVIKHRGVPPYRETETYVDKVDRRYRQKQGRQQTTVTEPDLRAVTRTEETPQEPAVRSLEVVTDDSGRIYLRSR